MEARGLRHEADICVATSNSRTECGECAGTAADASKRKHSPSSFSPKRLRADQSKITDVQTALHITEKSVGLAKVLGRSSSSNNRESFLGEHEFFSYRLEHRSSISPSLAMHPGEERILIFASNQPGVVAKIIFSVATELSGSDEAVQARIHVLEVKPLHRGCDLGGLLVAEAMQALHRRFPGRTIQCFLDAEEEDDRHGKLIGFYHRLGFGVKPNARIQYLNNTGNDGENYRKIPMVVVSGPTQVFMPDPFAAFDLTLNCNFLPVHLQSKDRSDISFSSASDGERRNRKWNWILIDGGNGLFSFSDDLWLPSFCFLLWRGTCRERQYWRPARISILQRFLLSRL